MSPNAVAGVQLQRSLAHHSCLRQGHLVRQRRCRRFTAACHRPGARKSSNDRHCTAAVGGFGCTVHVARVVAQGTRRVQKNIRCPSGLVCLDCAVDRPAAFLLVDVAGSHLATKRAGSGTEPQGYPVVRRIWHDHGALRQGPRPSGGQSISVVEGSPTLAWLDMGWVWRCFPTTWSDPAFCFFARPTRVRMRHRRPSAGDDSKPCSRTLG